MSFYYIVFSIYIYILRQKHNILILDINLYCNDLTYLERNGTDEKVLVIYYMCIAS